MLKPSVPFESRKRIAVRPDRSYRATTVAIGVECVVKSVGLIGRSILVLEDEPLIALEIGEALRYAGASVFMANSLEEAQVLAQHPDLSAAVLDFQLTDGDAATVCERLSAREIPFVVYSGREPDAVPPGGIFLPKPSRSDELISAVTGLLH